MTNGSEGSGTAASSRGFRGPARPPGEVIRDLEAERTRLVDAVDRVKVEAQALKARLLSRRVLVIAAGAVVALVVVRWALRRR